MNRASSMVVAAAILLLVVGCSSTDDGGTGTDARPAGEAGVKDAAVEQGVDASDQGTQDAQPEVDSGDASSADGADDAKGDVVTADQAIDGPADASTDALTDLPPDDAADDAAEDSIGDLPPIADGTFPPPPDAVPDGAKTGDGPPLGCGPVSFEGCCRGEVLYFCAESGVLQSVDCSVSPKCGWDDFYQLYDCATDGAASPTDPKPCPF